MAPKEPAMQPAGSGSARRRAGRDDAAAPGAGKRKTGAAATERDREDLSRRGAGALPARHAGRGGFVERLVTFWSNHFCVSASKGGLVRILAGCVRARGDPPACARQIRRHAARGGAASGDAAVPRQPAIARAELARGHQPQARTERKSRARDPRTAHARRRRRLYAGRRHVAGAHHHRLDLCRPGRAASATPGTFVFNVNAHRARARTRCSARAIRTPAWRRAQAALRDLARHPSTAKFIATKLVRHFVADDPPPALVARLPQRFTKTDGDLQGGRARAARCRRSLEGAADQDPHALRIR